MDNPSRVIGAADWRPMAEYIPATDGPEDPVLVLYMDTGAVRVALAAYTTAATAEFLGTPEAEGWWSYTTSVGQLKIERPLYFVPVTIPADVLEGIW